MTSVNVGAGLSGGPITGSGTLAVDTSQIQKRVASTCPAGSYLRGINADGTVQCSNVSTRTVFVTPVGTPAENGTALLAAVAGIAASAADPWLVKLDAGVYDLGNAMLTLDYVSLEGSGQTTTTITSTGTADYTRSTIHVSSPLAVREVTVSCTGGAYCVAISVLNVYSIEDTLLSRAKFSASSTAGFAVGVQVYGNLTQVTMKDLTISADTVDGYASGVRTSDFNGDYAAARQIKANSIDVSATSGPPLTIPPRNVAIWKGNGSIIYIERSSLNASGSGLWRWFETSSGAANDFQVYSSHVARATGSCYSGSCTNAGICGEITTQSGFVAGPTCP